MHFTFPFRPHSLRSHKGHLHSGSGKCVWGGEGASLSQGPWVSLSQHCVWINQQSPDLERHPFFRFKSIHSPPPTIACWVSETHWTLHVSLAIKTADHCCVPGGAQGRGPGVSGHSNAVRSYIRRAGTGTCRIPRELRTLFRSRWHALVSVVSEFQLAAGFSLRCS